MPQAARKLDPTNHGQLLSPGPASPDVNIEYKKAWRALPVGVGVGLEIATGAMKLLMDPPMVLPPTAAAHITVAEGGFNASANGAAGAGNGAAAAGVSSAMASLNAANAALTATWTTASAAPGGEPAATQAYTLGIKQAAGAAAAAAVNAIAAGIADVHNCPMSSGPAPHGPGVVTRGCETVFINYLPAARQNDVVYEATGGADPIAVGAASVNIGDLAGGGGGGGGGAGGAWETSQTAASQQDAFSGVASGAIAGGAAGSAAAASGGQGDASDSTAYFGQALEEEEEMVDSYDSPPADPPP
ncbi:MAG: hypothetical protein D6744_10815, partial [Planctomycetota bacterium]